MGETRSIQLKRRLAQITPLAHPLSPLLQLAGRLLRQLCLCGLLLSSALPLSRGGFTAGAIHMLGPVCGCWVVIYTPSALRADM